MNKNLNVKKWKSASLRKIIFLCKTHQITYYNEKLTKNEVNSISLYKGNNKVAVITKKILKKCL